MSNDLSTFAAEVAYLRRDYEALRKTVRQLAERADSLLLSDGRDLTPYTRKLLHDLIDADK